MKASVLGHIITDYVNSKGNVVSPKKLQKLVFYVEAWHLVHFDNSIVDENFQAWVHGPVVPELYQELKEFGFNNISVVNDDLDNASERINKNARENNLSNDQLDLIFSVLDKYAPLNSFELEMLSHSEDPWLNARGELAPHSRCNTIIDKGFIKKYYASQLAS